MNCVAELMGMGGCCTPRKGREEANNLLVLGGLCPSPVLSPDHLGANSRILQFPFLQLALPSQGSVLRRGEFGFEGFWPHTVLGTALFADGAGDGSNFRSDSQKQDQPFPRRKP